MPTVDGRHVGDIEPLGQGNDAGVGGAPQRHVGVGLHELGCSLEDVGGTVTCPAGQTALIRTEPSGARHATCVKTCRGDCALRVRRLAPAKGDRRILIAPDEELFVAARQEFGRLKHEWALLPLRV